MKPIPVFKCTNRDCGFDECYLRKPHCERGYNCAYAMPMKVGVMVYKPLRKRKR